VAFRKLIEGYISKSPITDAYILGVEIIKTSGISAEVYADKDPENTSRQENLEEFLAGMQDYVETRREEGHENETSLADFLQEVSLLTDLESDDDAEKGKVSLMTVHSAKGLEFPTVFIVGMEENIFPSMMSADTKRGLEEERRLFYVAITRAKRHCILTYTLNRYRYGKTESQTPSRFLKEIDPKLLNIENTQNVFLQQQSPYSTNHTLFGGNGFRQQSQSDYGSLRNSRWQNSHPVASQFKADPMPREARPHDRQQTAGSVREGNIIEHERFGIGSIIHLEGNGENQKATVEFKNVGMKQLLLKFARFKVIG